MFKEMHTAEFVNSYRQFENLPAVYNFCYPQLTPINFNKIAAIALTKLKIRFESTATSSKSSSTKKYGLKVSFLIIVFVFLVLLCPAKEKQPRVHPPRHPPRHHAHVGVVWSEIHPWWSFHFLRVFEYLRPHHHVQLLPPGGPWTPVPQVPVVEEVPHHNPNGMY